MTQNRPLSRKISKKKNFSALLPFLVHVSFTTVPIDHLFATKRGRPVFWKDLSMSTPAQTTIIASHTYIKGEVQLSGPATIAGRIEGAVTSQDQIDVTTEAYIEGDVQAAVIEINGSIKGNILATRSCRLGPTAKVAGELRAANLSIAEGACFIGQVSVGTVEAHEESTSTQSVANRLDALAADSRELAEMAAAPAAVRVNADAVQKALHRSPQIIKPRA